jgi:Protein of unknown function (DUF1367)
MTDVYLRRTLSGFAPADEAATEALRRIKQGATVLAEIRQPRNVRFHRMFFGLLQTTWQACGDWPSVEALLRELKFRTGHVDRQRVVDRKSGEVLAEIVVPRSISFAAMSEPEFHEFYERCIRVICGDMVPGLEDAVLREEVLRRVA